jgi:hypothetical protein
VVSLEPHVLEPERRPLVDKLTGDLGFSSLDGNDHRDARPRHLRAVQPSEELVDLTQEAHSPQGRNQHPLAGGAPEHERLLAVDAVAGSATDFNRGKIR